MKSLEEEIPITKPSFFRVENVSFRRGVLIFVAFFSLQKDGYVLAAWLVAPLPHLQGPSASVLVMSNLFPTPQVDERIAGKKYQFWIGNTLW